MNRLARLTPAGYGEAARLPEEAEPIPLTEFARSLYRYRRRRDMLFQDGLFGEPGWDILLSLFAADEREEISVARACAAAAAPKTTALRYIAKLQAIGLIERRPVVGDRRCSILRLTPLGRHRVRSVLAELRKEMRI